MTELLGAGKADRVLEIGTGSGYQAAILAGTAKHVYTIEIVPELAKSARERLAAMGSKNITVRLGDGYKGWPEEAPFDRIILTAAPPEIPRNSSTSSPVAAGWWPPSAIVRQDRNWSSWKSLLEARSTGESWHP
jgi:protein-L-isoaspartate(D-aspartate) O-methyltransferase